MNNMISKDSIKRMKRTAFRKGFAEGFSAPFSFFSPLDIGRPLQFDGSVRKAWADVGDLLSDAMIMQGEHIEQKTGKKIRPYKARKSG